MRLAFRGFEDCYRRLKKLEKKEAKKIWRKAVSAGARVLLKVARPLVPSDTKTLRKSLGVRVKVRKKDGVLVATVGPRRKFIKLVGGKKRWASKYAHLVHDGRKGFVNKRGVYIPRVIGRPYLMKAMRRSGPAVVAAMRAKVQEMLNGI